MTVTKPDAADEATAPESLDDFAPWPQTEAEATADRIARNVAVEAWAQNTDTAVLRSTAFGPDGTTDDKNRYNESAALVVGSFATVFLLRAFKQAAPAGADKAAAGLGLHLMDGGSVVELLAEWLTEYGIDPEQVSRVAEKQRAEHAVAVKG